MKEYFNFNGTAKRQEYWAVLVLSIVGIAIGFVVLEGSGGLGALIALILFVGTLWAVLAVTVKRLRDAGLSVWWILAILVPYIGTVATIAFGCIGSKKEIENA
jgi:uncharacterized membrane protein YhaH (DUF805 family)